MNLFLMITQLIMLVVGVDFQKKTTNYTSIDKIVYKDMIFKGEMIIICDSFKALYCSSSNNIYREDILEYCLEDIDIIVAEGKPLNEFYDSFQKLSNIEEVKSSYMFLNQILKSKRINISNIFETIKMRLNDYTYKSLSICNKYIQYYNSNSNFVFNVSTKICNEYIASILKINNSIVEFDLANSGRINERRYLAKLICAFFQKYYNNDDLAQIIPMDVNTRNNYMLFLSILRLDDVITNNSDDFTYNDCLSHRSNNINIKDLIDKLSIEIFMFLAQHSNPIIYKMRDNITASNIKFWDQFNISKFLSPGRILYINCHNLIEELKVNYFIDLTSLNEKDLKDYKVVLEELTDTMNNIFENGGDYGAKLDKYSEFVFIISELINKINDKIASYGIYL